jgi:transcriptional regulator with GAF, ATPase, and Fis domain
LLDTDGTVMGHLSVLDNKPMPKHPRAISRFEIFAARAVAEHRRLKVERVWIARDMEDLERANIARALEHCDWMVLGENGAARLIGVPASTLSSPMKALGIRKSQG